MTTFEATGVPITQSQSQSRSQSQSQSRSQSQSQSRSQSQSQSQSQSHVEVEDGERQSSVPDVESLLESLVDADRRRILAALDEPKSAMDLVEECDLPSSTAYRKLDRLRAASLVRDRLRIRADGRHETVYALAFEEVRVGLDDSRELSVAIDRGSATADEQLVDLWSMVRGDDREG